jgi:hypothetical protein
MKVNKNYLIGGGTIIILIVVGYFLLRKKDGTKNTVIDKSSDEPDNNISEKSSESEINTETNTNTNTNTNTKKENTSKKENSPKTEVPKSKENSSKINNLKAYIKKYALPEKYYNKHKSYLFNRVNAENNLDYLQSWVNAIKLRISTNGKKGTVFTHKSSGTALGFYDSYMGGFETGASVINKKAFVKKEYIYVYNLPQERGYFNRMKINKGKEIGVVKGVFYNIDDGRLYYYIPDTKFNPSLTQQMDAFNLFQWVDYGDVVLK